MPTCVLISLICLCTVCNMLHNLESFSCWCKQCECPPHLSHYIEHWWLCYIQIVSKLKQISSLYFMRMYKCATRSDIWSQCAYFCRGWIKYVWKLVSFLDLLPYQHVTMVTLVGQILWDPSSSLPFCLLGSSPSSSSPSSLLGLQTSDICCGPGWDKQSRSNP